MPPRFAPTAFAFGLALGLPLSASAVTLSAGFSAQVEEDEIDAFGTDIDQAFFNVQGDDDDFTVYSLVDFTPTATPDATGITDVSLSFTQSNAFFTADGALEFFLASDTRAVTLADPARFVTDGDNTGAEVVGDAFGTLTSLGGGTFTETATGDTDTFSFALSAAAEAALLAQVNAGGTIRIIATPGDLGVQATYGGALPFIDGVVAPTLSFTAVPEPAGLALLGMGGLVVAGRRRRA